MKQLMARLAVVVSLVIGAAAGDTNILAHGGHDHKVLGTITMAASDHVMVKDTAGKNVTVKVTKTTKIKSSPTVKVQDLKAGTRVVITAQEGKDKSMTASLIEVGVASAKK
jgi:hypothetical protein